MSQSSVHSDCTQSNRSIWESISPDESNQSQKNRLQTVYDERKRINKAKFKKAARQPSHPIGPGPKPYLKQSNNTIKVYDSDEGGEFDPS
jgi:hypothetical protein